MVEKDEEIETEEVETDQEIELEEQTLIASIVIHAADISGAAKTETLEMKWARRNDRTITSISSTSKQDINALLQMEVLGSNFYLSI